MQISAVLVKELREKTGAGVLECRNVLEETQGNMDRACHILRERGLARAEKKMTRQASQGLIEAYVHPGSRIGAMVELNCETDFVARTAEFRELAHNLALQVAATAPQCIRPEELPAETQENPEEVCLLLQSYIKDPTRKVGEIIKEVIARVGENIQVRRFARFELGVWQTV